MRFSVGASTLSLVILTVSTVTASYHPKKVEYAEKKWHTEIPVPYGKHSVLVTKTNQLVTIEEKTSHTTHYTLVTPHANAYDHEVKPYKEVESVDVIIINYVVPYDKIGPHAIPGYHGSGYSKNKAVQVIEVRKCVNDRCEKYEETRSFSPPKKTVSQHQRSASATRVYSNPGTYTITLWPETCHTTYVHGPTVITYPETKITCHEKGTYTATLTPKCAKTTHVNPSRGHPTTVHCHTTSTYHYTYTTTPCHTHKNTHTSHYSSHHSTHHTTHEHSTHHTTTEHHSPTHHHTTSKHHTTTKHHPTSSKHHPTSSKHHPTSSKHHPTTSKHHPTTSRHHPTTSKHHPTTSKHHPTTSKHHPTTTTHHSHTTTTANPSGDLGYEYKPYYEARAAEEARAAAEAAPAAAIEYRQLPDDVVRRGGVLRSKRSAELKKEVPQMRRDFSIPRRSLL